MEYHNCLRLFKILKSACDPSDRTEMSGLKLTVAWCTTFHDDWKDLEAELIRELNSRNIVFIK